MSNKKFYTDVEIKAGIILDNEAANSVLSTDATGAVKSTAVTKTQLEAFPGDIAAIQAELAALPDPVVYKGLYDASTNTPALANTDTGKTGFLYYVNVAGTHDFGAGAIELAVGDKVVNNGTTWDKWDMTDAVSSVFGRTGAVTAQSGDYSAGQVTFTPGPILTSQTDVQSAIDQTADWADQALDGLATHLSNPVDAHDASAISFDGVASGLVASNVQAAIDELAARPTGSTGDIVETSFSLTNNQATPANVTGFLFTPATVRSFDALVSVEIDAAADLYEVFRLQGIQRGSDFQMSIEATGDDSGITFSITSAGQVQYTSTDVAGFATGVMKFRAITTSI